MYLTKFPVASTHIFPLVNSTKGGQLVTEYNLKSRESVATNPAVSYVIGQSFIHSLNDFKVTLLSNADIPEYDASLTYAKGDYCRYLNTTYVCIQTITSPEPFNVEHWGKTSISGSILQVNAGRAVINGHYIESVAPITVDLALANIDLKQQGKEQLYGNLSIGFRTFFSTENTMSGAMRAETNSGEEYIGIQLVVERTAKFITPNESPTDRSKVVADLKLADFSYVNGIVADSSIKMNPEATRYITPDRITNFDTILNEKYVTSENLVDRMFYTFSGQSGWCDSTDSIMIWDADSAHRQTTVEPTVTEATFGTAPDGSIHLVVPHKQQDGAIYNDNDERLYYADRDIPFPMADYNNGTPGAVSAEYTEKLKELEQTLNTYKQFTNGKQIWYLDRLSIDSSTGELSYEFPDANKYNVGDYILVREDYTTTGLVNNSAGPTTMYFVVPGGVTSITFGGKTKPSGIKLGTTQVLYGGDDVPPPTPSVPTMEELNSLFGYTTFQGTTDDYFELVYHNTTDTTDTPYYYPVASTGPNIWSQPILVTGGIPLATTGLIGGFFNVPSNAEYADAGYVYLDSTGHLRLMDYGLLRTGTLAYQLGSDYRVASNSTLAYIQEDLDENVNARIAFKTNLVSVTTVPPMINVYITLPAEDSGTLTIYNLDSRFDTGVYLHFVCEDTTKDYSNIVINIADCQKIRIDNTITNITSGPVINVFRSCLYYDAAVINYIRLCDIANTRAEMFPGITNFTGFDGLTLWYSRFTTSDPDLIVNGMEISQPNVSMSTQEISFWSETVPGDNHYNYALRSITLSGSGNLIACSIYVSNGSTRNINTTQHTIIGGDFKLPNGSSLNYPQACITSPLKITGTFTMAYLDDRGENWITTETSFTALTGVYSPISGMANGSIAFNSETQLVPAIYTNVDSIGGWEPDSYHIFYGGTTV